MILFIRRIALGLLLSSPGFTSPTCGAETSAPPANVEFVPVRQAVTLVKHPTLPVLYVGCYGYPEQKNLITFQLGADGVIATNTMKVCENYFSVNATNSEFIYRILPKPAVFLKENVLVLACTPNYHTPYFAETNNNECAVIALDEQGQPAKLLKSFRTSNSSREGLISMHGDPTTSRLHLAYYVTFGWCQLGGDGLPVTKEFVHVPCPINQWYIRYIPDWQRFYTMPPGPSLNAFKLAPDGRTLEFLNQMMTPTGTPYAGNFEVHRTLRRMYILSNTPQQELAVFTLTAEGRLTGLPRCFNLGSATLVRVDSKARKLYAAAKEWLRIYNLDADGYPTGTPSLHSLDYGLLSDALVDEATGKIYLACTDPPQLKK